MTSAAFFDSSALPPPWHEAREAYRRVCLLLARGRKDEAAAARVHFARVEAAARGGTALEPEAAAKWEAMLAAEEGRVAEAATLAELIAALLQDKLAPAVVAGAGANPAPSTSAAPAPRPEIPGVADLIEEMLAQERALRIPAP